MADDEFDLSTLSNHLWESANILRGPVDAADFKTYIFRLLFFKRISDVYDEEIAWVQHMILSMAPTSGRMAVVLPHGSLFRMGAEGKIRQKLLGMDILDAVIGLGTNLFYATGLAACILVFRQKKAASQHKKVLIVDASKEFKKGRAQNELLLEHVHRIYQWYAGHKGVVGVARLVPLDAIQQNDWNLNIPRYVEPVVEARTISVADALANLKTSLDAAYAAKDRLMQLSRESGVAEFAGEHHAH